MKTTRTRVAALVLGVAATALLAGCSNYVKKDDFNAAIAELQATDQQLQSQVDSLKAVQAELQQKFAKYDARLTAMEGRIRVDNVAYFDFDKAELKDQYKPMLDEFAKVMSAHHANAVVTVEGFADPSGAKAYNKRLGLERAQAVRDYLVNQGGMAGTSVRAVSYGEAANRQLAEGESRAAGKKNRRAVLVIDMAS